MFIEWLLTHMSIGGNTGTVNSFTGVNFEDLTGGILNAETLLEGLSLLCFRSRQDPRTQLIIVTFFGARGSIKVGYGHFSFCSHEPRLSSFDRLENWWARV
jgi:hypothetical protein